MRDKEIRSIRNKLSMIWNRIKSTNHLYVFVSLLAGTRTIQYWAIKPVHKFEDLWTLLLTVARNRCITIAFEMVRDTMLLIGLCVLFVRYFLCILTACGMRKNWVISQHFLTKMREECGDSPKSHSLWCLVSVLESAKPTKNTLVKVF